jgi:hypothetical protein
MSFIETAEIEYNSTKNCFLTIPKTWNICSTNVWFESLLNK